jgi:hypothetical protein
VARRFQFGLLTRRPRLGWQQPAPGAPPSPGRSARLLALFAVVSVLAGCAPMVSSIYRPEVPGGELSGEKCGGRVGPKEVVTFGVGAVRVRMSALRLSDERARVSVTYLVPSHVTLRFAAAEFIVTEQASGRTQRYTITRLTHATAEGRWEEIPVQSEISGGGLGAPPRGSPGQFFGAFTTEGRIPDVFEVQLPPAVLNGASTDFPKVLFRRVEEAWISPFNC